MKLAVLGGGVEGHSAQRYWQQLGHEATLRDIKDGPDYLDNLDSYDLVVRSPGVKPSDITAANPTLNYAKVTSVTNEFLSKCPAKVIGVTGSKGKGTTSTLIDHMLRAAGHSSHLGGNIGKAALDLLPDISASDWVVLELSSFQLIDIRTSPHVAVMLMVSPDHLNWHPDMRDYLAAKQKIFTYQEAGDRAVYNACNIYSVESGLAAPSEQIAYNSTEGAYVQDDKVMIGQTLVCSTSDIALAGRHNWDNVCAAITAVWPIIRDIAPIVRAIKAFTGLEHRLEKVAQINGVTYINDSCSPTPSSSLAALQAFAQPKVIILGGFDRGHDYNLLAEQVASGNVRHAILIGAISAQLVAALDQAGYSDYSLGSGEMDEIVELARREALPGDLVLFSPGAPSFDMFVNFTQRGQAFKRAVAKLKEGAI